MASSAFVAGSLSDVYRWRYVDGAGAQDMKPIPMAASQTIRDGDIVTLSSGKAARLTAPRGSVAGEFTLSGTGAAYGIARQTKTTGASPTMEDTIQVIPIEKAEVLCRLIGNTANGAATATNSKQDDKTFDAAYRIGIYEPDNGTTNYYPVLSHLTTSGQFKISEFADESVSTDDYGLVWIKSA